MELEFEADCKLNAVEMPRKWLWTKKTTTLCWPPKYNPTLTFYDSNPQFRWERKRMVRGEAVLSHLCVYRSIKRQRTFPHPEAHSSSPFRSLAPYWFFFHLMFRVITLRPDVLRGFRPGEWNGIRYKESWGGEKRGHIFLGNTTLVVTLYYSGWVLKSGARKFEICDRKNHAVLTLYGLSEHIKISI